MLEETLITLLLGSWLFWLGQRLGRVMLRRGATANDLFKGKTGLSVAFLFLYLGLLLLARFVPEMQALPLEWRFYGLQVTWTAMRSLLLLICGMAFTVSWHTARVQVVAVVLIGLLGLGAFSAAEAYFLAPIHASLQDNLQPNGVFKQTSSSSCGPSALATVLRRWGIEATESSVARLAGTSRLGTFMPQLLVATRSLGMEGMELEPTWEQMQHINRPGVLGVWFRDGVRPVPHAVALLALSADVATIGDPAWGKIYYVKRSQFERNWRGQYAPIFRPQDTSISHSQAKSYLERLGYKSQTDAEFEQAIRRFQKSVGVRVTGKLEPQTVLLLSGSFLEGVPTLKSESRHYSATAKILNFS